MDKVSKHLWLAAEDFFFLSTRGYDRNHVLEVVGNRYNLSASERDILRRGIFGQRVALLRRGKKFTSTLWQNKIIMIDGHNVHITLESIILGRTIVYANDGVLRDVARISGKFRLSPATDYIIDLIVSFFLAYPPKTMCVLFDAPISKSGELASLYRRRLAQAGIKAVCVAVPVPERQFDYDNAIISSSDGAVLDRAVQWVDLPKFIISYRNISISSLFVDFSSLIMMDLMSGCLYDEDKIMTN